MKTRILALLLALAMILSGCSSNSAITDTGITTIQSYKDYSFWEKDNNLRLVTNISIIKNSQLDEDIEIEEEKELSGEYKKNIKELREGIISYFLEFYNVDVSKKISKQTVKVFSTSINNGITMGYVNPSNPNTLYLNEMLFSHEYNYLFNNTYIHETIHQLGIRNMAEDGMLVEGLADAYADLILCYMEKKSHTTDFYWDCRTLCYQIIAVDKDLPHLYFETENFSLVKRINDRLDGIPQKYEQSNNIGKRLYNLLSIFYSMRMGYLESNNDPFFYAYDAQEIARAYCHTFNPSEEQIDYIRSHYLVEDFEKINFVSDGNGYYVE